MISLKTPKIILVAFLMVAMGWDAFAEESASPRIALVATTLNPDSEKFLDLATVELSSRSDLELVERDAIRKVLGEQELNLGQAEGNLAVGKLLRADLIGVLETTPDGKEAGGFAVLDSATGISYWNQGVDQKSIEGVAGEVLKGVSAALEKRRQGRQLSTVCMLGARNAEFPRSMDVFCETVAYLLDRQLVANPSVTTLDRRRLETVISENTLPGVEPKQESLLPSLRLVELDFRRGEAEDEVKVLARVTDAGGTLIAQPELTGPVDAAELADRLQAALAGVLRAQPQQKAGNRKAEANRFRVQGHILWKRGLPDQAIQSLDAAYALNSGNQDEIVAYVSILAERAAALAREGDCASAIKLIQRTMDIEERHQAWHAGAGSQYQDSYLEVIRTCKPRLFDEMPMRHEFDVLLNRYRRNMGLTANSSEVNQVQNPAQYAHSFDGVPVMFSGDCSEHLPFRADAARLLCGNADEFYRALNAHLDGWLEREADLSQSHDKAVVLVLNDICSNQRSWESNGWIPLDEEYVRGMEEVARRLSGHPRLVVQLEGLYFSLLIDCRMGFHEGVLLAQDEYVPRAEKIISMALEGITDPQTPPGDIPVIYEMAARVVEGSWVQWQTGSKKEWTDSHLHQIAMAMFDNHHISGTILLMIEHLEVDFEKYRKPLLWRLKAVKNNRSYKRYDLSRQYLKDLLRVLPAPSANQTSVPSAESKMEVLWQTPPPEDWRNRLVGLHIEDEALLYAYTGYQWHYERTENPLIQVVRLDLSTGLFDILGKIQVNICWGEQLYTLHSRCKGEFIEDSACSASHLWLATSGDGLYGISLETEGDEPVHIGVAEGLPSDTVHSVLPLGDSLYVGCGQDGSDGYLVRYDLNAREVEVLVSTMRASPETPLDSLPNGFHLEKILHDKPRNRLLLMVNEAHGEANAGLWEYHLEDAAFRKLLKMGWPAREVKVGEGGKVELYLNRVLNPQYVFYYGVVEFDPETDKARMVFVNQKRGASEELPMDFRTRRYRNILFGSNALGGDWFYHWGFKQVKGEEWFELRRINLKTGKVMPVPGQEPVVASHWNVPASERVNVFGWGRLWWLPRSRTVIIGNGGQFSAVEIGG